MSQFSAKSENAGKLAGKVVVLTGGANGIGATTVEAFCKAGAKVVFGDVNISAAEKLQLQLKSAGYEDAKFISCDVTKYGDVLSLFDLALKTFGKVDIAISSAGVAVEGKWINPALDLESIKEAPSTIVVDVNLTGSLYFARIAVVYLQQGKTEHDDKSMILMSSVTGFKEAPSIPVYSSTKHGVLGLMRASRRPYAELNMRVNCLCPWFVDTQMASSVKDLWAKTELAMNTPSGVAQVILGLSADNTINGRAFYLEGDRAWDIEEGINVTEPQWLGEPSQELQRGQQLLKWDYDSRGKKSSQ